MQAAPRASTQQAVETILPVLKSFPTNEVAIIGCHSHPGMSRPSCEYNLLIVSREPVPAKFVRMGGGYAEILFKSEHEIRQPEVDLAMALSSAIPLRDNSLLLASAIAESKRSFRNDCKKSMETRLASSLKALGRVDELLAAGQVREADYWLLSSACEFAEAELLTNGVVPAPSHILTQLKALPKRKSSNFKQWAEGFGLELSSKASCENRLEAVSVVFDAVRNTAVTGELATKMSRYREVEAIQVITAKAKDLEESMQSVEAYAYLGQEAVKSLLDLYTLHTTRVSLEKDYSSMIRDLTVGEDRLLSEEVTKSLGLVRTQENLRVAADGMKSAVSSLAKKI
ncbi:MAG: hypothetical protein OK456_09885 [Thaumarchaeota archaeon]|nr:hypothetical protein [Nitrososphaerota archaeon]